MKKFLFSWIKKCPLQNRDLASEWLIYWFGVLQGKPWISLLLKIFFKKIKPNPIVRMETAFHYPSDFCLFLVTFGNDIFWNSQISIKWLVSTFRCWQFSRSSFFCTKNITKKLIWEFQLSAPHLVGFGSQKEFPFDRCTYRGSLFLHFFQQF